MKPLYSRPDIRAQTFLACVLCNGNICLWISCRNWDVSSRSTWVYEMKANTTEVESVVSAHYDGWCATLGPPCLLPLGCFFACLKSISLFADACYCSRRLPPSARVALFKTAKCVGVQTAFRRTPECINCCKRGPTGLS